MRLYNSSSLIALVIVMSASSGAAFAGPANTTPSNVNILNLLSPFLSLNSTSVGQTTLQDNLT